MEYIAPNKQGFNSLDDHLKHQPLDLTQSLRWAIHCCHGLEYAYTKGLHCHRDIKPKNILISQDNTAKISDFGLGRFRENSLPPESIALTEDIRGWGDNSRSEPSMTTPARATPAQHSRQIEERPGAAESTDQTEVGQGFGTPTHMSPEQFKNATICDERSDIYSFGVVLYQMVTGRQVPFDVPRPKTYAGKARFWQEIEKLHNEAPVPKLESPLFPIIQRCLEKRPEQRYANFKALRLDLERLLKQKTGETITVPGFSEFEAWEWNNKGCSLHTLGRDEEALKCYNKALKLNPAYIMAWNNKGNSLNSLGHFDQAVFCFDKAIALDPEDAAIWNNKATSLNYLGRIEEAIHCFDQALTLDRYFVQCWHNKAVCLFSLGQDDEAIRCLDKAIELDPKNAATWNSKGVILNNLERDEEAIDCFDRAVKIDPWSSVAWNNRGLSLVHLGDNDEAFRSFDNALTIDPHNNAAWKNIGLMLNSIDGYEEIILSQTSMMSKFSAKTDSTSA
jgi:tetratricopeptide (TPR) repeat protein